MDRSLEALALAAFAVFSAGCANVDEEGGGQDDGTGLDTGGADPLTTDDDLDGVSENDGDCNDRNDAVYPGARERSFDGIDSDCDGSEMPSTGDDLYAEALPLLDTDGDDAISFDEFEAACAASAMVLGEANSGVAQTHSDCGGTNSCRGMVLHSWNELYEHDCRGVNSCAGWSCVETAQGEGRDGATAFTAARCDWCHAGSDGAFLVQVPEGEDVDAWMARFAERSDTAFLSAIAFGVQGVSSDGVASSDMPGHHEVLSRAEMDTLVAYIRGLPVEAPSAE